jgi:hypothetical protein
MVDDQGKECQSGNLKQLTLSEPFQFGFGHGFGFKPEEVDSVMGEAMASDAYVEHQPIISLYYLIWEYTERQDNQSVTDRRPSLAASTTETDNKVVHRRRASDGEASPASIMTRSAMKKPRYDSDELASPRKVHVKEFASTKDASSLISTKPPMEQFTDLVLLMKEEGITVEANEGHPAASKNLIDTLKSGSLLSLVRFMRENRLSNGGYAWTLQCAWKPSLGAVASYLQFFNTKQIRFDIELVQIDTSASDTQPKQVNQFARRYSSRQDPAPMFGLQFQRISGDPVTYQRIMDRIFTRFAGKQ